MKKILYIVPLIALFFIGCSEDDNPIKALPTSNLNGIVVVNEGTYGSNNSALSFISFTNDSSYADVYFSANNKSLGDNANDIVVVNDTGYIAVDNSNKIEVVDLNTYKSLGVIDLGVGSSPRNIYIDSDRKGYVSSLYNDEIIRFDINTRSVLNKIKVGSKPEGIVKANGMLFVANTGFGESDSVSVVDPSSGTIVKNIKVGFNPRRMFTALSGKVIVVCTGKYPPNEVAGGVYIIDPATRSIVDSITVGGNPSAAALQDDSNLLLVNNTGLYRINLQSKVQTLIITGNNVNSDFGVIYSVAWDAVTKNIYVGNPRNFTSKGEILNLSESGAILKKYNVGINPGAIKIFHK